MQMEYSFLLCFTPDPLITTSFEQSHIFSVNILKKSYKIDNILNWKKATTINDKLKPGLSFKKLKFIPNGA